MRVRPATVAILTLVLPAIVLLGCGPPANTFVEPPPPEVTVSLPLRQPVADSLDLTGTTAAKESVDVRARVQGFLERINFKDGAKVKAGELLFVIDPKPYQATVDQMAAALRSVQASLNVAQIDLNKATQLCAKNVISEIEFVEKTGKRDQMQAQVGVAEANLRAAQLDLDYTRVSAPIGGRTSRRMVDVGNLVGASEKTLLTTIVDEETIYAYANISEYELLTLNRRYRRQQQPEKSPPDKQQQTKALLGLADEAGYPHEGWIDFIDNKVDSSTGTLRIRAVFPNETGLLMAGLFVRLRIPISEHAGLLVPETAVLSGQGGRYVLVVGDKDVVAERMVKLGGTVGHMQEIQEGIAATDRVIINGLQRARPGGRAKPVMSAEKKQAGR